MIPNLLEATNDYWRKLDELEISYQRGEVSLEEVDTKVAELMAELGQKRRSSLRFLWNSLGRFLDENKEFVLGIGALSALTYVWIVIN